MPMIGLITNVTISGSARAELARGFEEAVALVPGGCADKLMLKVEGESCLYFGGRDDLPCAYIWADLPGKAGGGDYAAFSGAAAQLLGRVLAIPRANVYVSVRENPFWMGDGM